MKLYYTNNFCYGTVLVSAAIIFYILVIHEYLLIPISIFVLVLIFVLFIRRISFQVEDENLILLNGRHQVFRSKLSNFQLYELRGIYFDLLTHNGDIFWASILINNRSSFLRDILPSRKNLVENAEKNTSAAIKGIFLVLSSIAAFAVTIVPIIQYNQIPTNENELTEVRGILKSIELQKLLKLQLSGHESSFILSPKAGDITDYESKLRSFINKDISLYVSVYEKKDQGNEIDVWSITDGFAPIISYDLVVSSWINWKRWGILFLIGILMLFYSVSSFRKLEFKEK